MQIDIESGHVTWEKPFDFSQCEFMTYLSYGSDTLLVTGSDREKNFHLYAFESRDGELIWQNTMPAKKTHHSGWLQHPVLLHDRVYVNKHTYDLRSGDILHFDPFDYHGCGTLSASSSAIFHRFEFHGMLDLETGERTEFRGVR